MATVITALIVVGIIASVICMLVFVNRRDMKKEALNSAEGNK